MDMKFLAYIIFAAIYSFLIKPAEAKTQVLSPTYAKNVEANYNKASSEKTWVLQKDQAFEVELNSKKLKDIVFAPFKDNIVKFVLLTPGGRSIIQSLPQSDLAVVNMFSFLKVNAVSFKDINGDGTKDILVLTTYFDSRPVQGDGIGGGTAKVGYAFISNKDEFMLNDDCGEDVAGLSALEKCLRRKLKK